MDAGALLRRQGWRGTGHSLDTHNRGIKKPLLISHKQDNLGLGQKKAAHRVDDQWWMRAFDESLKNIGSGQESTLSQVRKQGINRGGLYGFFVKGEGLIGTLSNTEESSAVASGTSTPPTSPDIPAEPMRPKPRPNKRRREADPAEESRKRQKEETEALPETQTVAIMEEHEEVIMANGTAQQLPEAEAPIWNSINRRVAKKIRKDEKKGLFDPPSSKKGPKKGSKKRSKKEKSLQATKANKVQKKAAMRAAKREFTKKLVVDAIMNGELPNPDNYTREQATEHYGQYMKRIKDTKDEAKKTKKAAKESAKDAAIGLPKAEKLAPNLTLQESNKYHSEPTSDKYSAKTIDPAVLAKLSKLTPSEKTDYSERAKAKNQTLEQYLLRRIQKKTERKTGKKTVSEPQRAGDLLFVTDLVGDEALLLLQTPEPPSTANPRPVDANPAPTHQENGDGSIPLLDPAIWKGRAVKSLSNQEREARRQWMAQRRERRKLAKEKRLRENGGVLPKKKGKGGKKDKSKQGSRNEKKGNKA